MQVDVLGLVRAELIKLLMLLVVALALIGRGLAHLIQLNYFCLAHFLG